WCEDTGRISNFEKAAGTLEGKFEGIFFNDSDVYKVIEGAAYMLHLERDPELEAYVDGVIAKIASAQQPDGYLNTYFTLVEPDKRWTDLPVKHELYCAGHMFEAAVAYYRATGKRTFLDVACRYADYIDSIFGEGKRYGVPGHEEIELALVKLYQVTNEERYLKLAKFFVDERGNSEHRASYGDYCQDHVPIRQQSEIAGHAVRAMYLYSGVADVARLTNDRELVDMMNRIWQDVVLRKMYVTGGIGPSAHNEGFTVAYDLPNDSAYAETCASIGMVLWNHRMNLLEADARFADVMERALYNGLLSGIALDGEHFFYVNPLASRGNHHRQSWFGCACCPTNLVRLLPSLGGYVYAHTANALYVNLYVTGSGVVPLDGGPVTVTQTTDYPWDGKVTLTVTLNQPAECALNLRIPGWCKGFDVAVNGAAVADVAVDKGYASVQRMWQSGDQVVLNLAMPVERVYVNPKVESNVGRAALQRGPMVYCLEGVDNGGYVRNLALLPGTDIAIEQRPDLLGGVTVLKGTALARQAEDWSDALYRETVAAAPVEFVAVPYCVWDHRDPGEMVVWLPECVGLAETPPAPTIANTSKASASFVEGSIGALSDQQEPENSNDHKIPRLTWWDHRGTEEWIQYEFAEPAKVSGVEVYWFDDEPYRGGCRLHKSWTILYKESGEWKPVANASEYGVEKDKYNRVNFDPVTAEGLRIVVQLRQNWSGGVLEWRVL
ncbi:MAG: uncharacterized protein QG656_1672, partial [Candidatus Hydrogenedentes bacterium]|nr:uncharacterized protein [Candidatus Hydrogenedentota bacterium]